MSTEEQTHLDWYKDAVIYELHVRSFYDSNDDGMGDFKGLTGKLDYFQDLGVNAIWLLPFYPSPWRDDGYDISDYTSIHPAYGTMRDFKRFLKEAHQRDLRVITELVINHTSSQHPWFERARRAKPGSRAREYYVWSETPELYQEARIIFQDFETSNWSWDPVANAYYWHRFYSHQPDLNFDNPEVRKEVFRLLDYWFEMGVDGLRLDAVPYLFEREGTNCENLPETHEFLKSMRSHVDEKFPGRMLLAEANQWPEDAVNYFGDDDECHMAFHFPLMPRLFMAAKMEDRFPVVDILEQTPLIPPSSQWGIFLRNHDELTLEMVTDEERDYMYRAYALDPRQRINLGIRRRLAPLLENNRRQIELMNALLFSLPGTPVIYYGDEVGMGDNVYLGDRDGVRTPMQWSSDKNAGFSKTNPQRLYLPVIIDPEYHYEAINVETQQSNSSSLLWWMKRVIATRRRFHAFSRGAFEVIGSTNHRVLAYVRRYEEEAILVIANFSRHTQVTHLDLSEYANYTPQEIFSENEFPLIRGEEEYTIHIGGYDYYWFTLTAPVEGMQDEGGGIPEIALSSREWKSFAVPLRKALEGRILRDYITGRRWFREKSLKVRSLTLRDAIPLGTGNDLSWVVVVDLTFTNDAVSTYVVPLAAAFGDAVEEVDDEIHGITVAALRNNEGGGILYDGVYSPAFRERLLETVASQKRLKGESGSLVISRGRTVRRTSSISEIAASSRVLKTEQSNTSILYRDVFFFKLYRKLEVGVNPDIELLQHLSDQGRFAHVPSYGGSVEYQNVEGESSALALLMENVVSQGDAWSYTRGAIERYFESLLERKHELEGKPPKPAGTLGCAVSEVPEEFRIFADGFFLEMMALLGRRTGELHLALASQVGRSEFKPEPFSKLYQRSVYQSLRSLFRRVASSARKLRRKPEVAEGIELLISLEEEILARFSRITEEKIEAQKIRIHGDYHLGQVLFTGRDFVIIDLEGEPARTLSERRLKYSAFRDVAGMLRSFHYAISSEQLRYAEVRPEDGEFLRSWVAPWYEWVRGVFLKGYLDIVDGASFVPTKETQLRTLIDVFVLEKAIYEVGYEINNRPDWLTIPLEGIRFVLSGSAQK
ncbi:MAG: maltose alpha-D-glucosyltransferase [Alkalispirochaetaceae bacterium]